MYISHSWEISQAVHTYSHTFRTLFTQSSRIGFTAILTTSRTLVARSYTIRKLFAQSHPIRTLFARSHTIRTVAHYSHGRTLFAHYLRGSHTIRAIVTPNSHAIRTSSHPGHTIRAVGQARSHSLTQYSRQFAQFTPVRICEYAICTL